MTELAKRHEQERRLTVKTATDYLQMPLGDSIMIDGVCLTITTKTATEATFDVMVPTVMTTKIGQYQPGTRVNLEKAMLATDRFDGHFVLGHVDGNGTSDRRSHDRRNGLLYSATPAPSLDATNCAERVDCNERREPDGD